MTLFITSCENYLDVNLNPNQSTSSDAPLQLSAGQLNIAIALGQRLFPSMGVWCQYQSGGPGVSLGEFDQHQMSSSEGNEIFTRIYRGINNLNYISKNLPNEKYYNAIVKITKSYAFQVCADVFGNIPYTEALKGDISDGSILHPKYNNAETEVYPALIQEVKDALDLIHNGAGSTIPGSDDLVYQGDMHKWEAFANSLLLKLYLRSGKSADAKALAESGASFIVANDEAALVAFPGGSAGSNPFWTAARSTALGNYFVATTTSIQYLESTSDPRIDFFYQKNLAGGHNGMKPGDVENAPSSSATFSLPNGATSATGGVIFGPTKPVIWMSAWESNLLLSEAVIGAAESEAYYDEAVTQSFDYLGVESAKLDAYLAGKGKYDAANALKTIALQKWVCMNGLQPVESWIETRRYDNASNAIFASRSGGIFIEPTKNALGAGKFPSIFPYPENEESLNQNFPGQHDITAKVFWDK